MKIFNKVIVYMKINGIRAMLIVSLVIVLLYILGLFLPIIKNTKSSKIDNTDSINYVKLAK